VTTDPLVAALRSALPEALRARDTEAASALRTALAAAANAEAVDTEAHVGGQGAAGGYEHVAGAVRGLGAAERERRALSGEEVRAIIEGEVRERHESAAELLGTGQTAHADRLSREAAVLQRVLDGERSPG
jgi:uncharacterized protein YqeY